MPLTSRFTLKTKSTTNDDWKLEMLRRLHRANLLSVSDITSAVEILEQYSSYEWMSDKFYLGIKDIHFGSLSDLDKLEIIKTLVDELESNCHDYENCDCN